MKCKFALWLSAVLAVLPVVHAADMVAPTSQVVLDWQQFIKLWEQANKPPTPPAPVPPPVEYMLSKAEYSGVVRPKATEITAVFDLNILAANTWVRVPFLPSSLGLKEATLDGKPVSVAPHEGFHSLITKDSGRHTLRVVHPFLPF